MDLLLSCVSENDPAWFRRVQNLVLSVRWFGGSLSEARFIVNFVGDAAPEYRDALGELDAEVRVVERFDGRYPWANKLRMFELHEEAEFDVLVGLDCDVVVVDDFSGHVPVSCIGAKPVEYDVFTDRDWRRLYETVDLRPPAKTLRATSSGKAVGPYFNGGVLMVPSSTCGQLRQRWGECHAELITLLQREHDPIHRRLGIYADQVSFTLAVASERMPWAALSVAMNFPCHVPVHRSALSGSPKPMILHHHDRLDPDGFLLRPRCTVGADAAHRFNRRRAEHLSLPYAGPRSQPVLSRLRLRGRLGRTLDRRHRIGARIRDLAGRRSGTVPRRS